MDEDDSNSYMIPKWVKHGDVEDYISQLMMAKPFFSENEGKLIFSSLMLSNRTHILSMLTHEEKTSIDKYCKWLQTQYGKSIGERKRALRTLKQSIGESITEYFFRTERVYQASKLSPKPLDEESKAEIQLYFIDGLRDPKVKREMLLSDDIDYDKLRKKASHIQNVLNEQDN